MHRFWSYPSTWLIFAVWGTMGFMAQPTLASFVVHFLIAPPLLLAGQWLAHWEGRHEA